MKYDLITAGAGLAGCCASVSAARLGLKVLLIERYGFAGGMATAGLVNPFMPYSTYDENSEPVTVNNAGLFLEILDRLAKRNGLIDDYHINRDNVWGGSEIKHETRHTFNEEVLKIVLDEMLEEAGVEVLYHSQVYKVEKDGRMLKSVSTAGKSGVIMHKAGFFIDATGDADLCSLAGCGIEIGRDDGKCQPMTLCFRIGNIDPTVSRGIISDKKARDMINERYRKAQKSGHITNKRENVLMFPNVSNGTIHLNSTRVIGMNALDQYDLTKAEKEARKQAMELVDFFRENIPGFENCILSQMAPQIGIRESRRIKGLYRLSERDLIECRKFNDSIARGCYPVDIHNPDGSGTRITEIPPGEYYTIPYRSIVPKDIDNILIAGRPISSSHEAHSAVRVMPICANMGEAAGIAAAVSVMDKKPNGDIDVDKIHQILEESGAVF